MYNVIASFGNTRGADTFVVWTRDFVSAAGTHFLFVLSQYDVRRYDSVALSETYDITGLITALKSIANADSQIVAVSGDAASDVITVESQARAAAQFNNQKSVLQFLPFHCVTKYVSFEPFNLFFFFFITASSCNAWRF
jgi:hypothetical protein